MTYQSDFFHLTFLYTLTLALIFIATAMSFFLYFLIDAIFFSFLYQLGHNYVLVFFRANVICIIYKSL